MSAGRLAIDRKVDSGGADNGVPGLTSSSLDDILARLAEAEDTLRAIGASEVDAFVISGPGAGQRVFTLETADRPYRIFVENMRDGAATVSEAGLILFANRRLAELLSCSRDTIVGSPLTRFLDARSRIGLAELRSSNGDGTAYELNLIDAAGRDIPVIAGSSLLDVHGEQLTCLTFTDLRAQRAQDREIARLAQGQAHKMAELEAAQIALRTQATHDALTGLPNRTLVIDRIDQALVRSQRSGCFTAVFFVDLDRFKQINDTRGHAVGDAVLCQIAAELTALLRPMDSVARLSGDEFVLVASDVNNSEHAVEIGRRIVSALSARAGDFEDGVRVTASVGLCVSEGGRGSAEHLIHAADKAMYKAKSRGGGCLEVFDAALGHHINQRSIARLELESALTDQRIIVQYQPVIDLINGGITGVEALARLARHDGSIMAPAEFIPVAEDSGLVVPLGAQVLGIACTQAGIWQATPNHMRALTVAVNVSARQFESGDLPTIVRRSLDESGLAATSLQLELTETTIIDLRPDILRQLGKIRDLGVGIGLDDFGTGYASLTHLRRLPLSFVKIDLSFVQGVNTSREDESIVSAIVSLARHLGLRSIAEGVETEEQRDRLRELGCDEAQGYLFARPVPPSELPSVIEALRKLPSQ